MFDIAWTEYVLILVVALVFLGPKELPVVLRTLGRWVAKARQFAANLEHHIYTLEDANSPSSLVPTQDTLKKPSFDSQAVPWTYQRVFSGQPHFYGSPLGERLLSNPLLKPWL